MTGATAIVRWDGTNVLLGKVRHSGYMLETFLKDFHFEGEDVPREFWTKFKDWYLGDMSPISRAADIHQQNGELAWPSGFVTTVDSWPDEIDEDNIWEILQAVEDKITDQEDSYLCSYSDYVFVIDYDKQTVYPTPGADDEDDEAADVDLGIPQYTVDYLAGGLEPYHPNPHLNPNANNQALIDRWWKGVHDLRNDPPCGTECFIYKGGMCSHPERVREQLLDGEAIQKHDAMYGNPPRKMGR